MPGDPHADVVVAIQHSSLCWRCIAAKAGLAAQELDAAMIECVVALNLAPCDGCQRDTLLYRAGSLFAE